MNVLHVVGGGGLGGVERFVADLVRHLDRDRFHSRVCILGPAGPLVDELRGQGIATDVLGISGFDLQGCRRYLQSLRKEPVHLLHTNVCGRMSRYLARLAGCRAIVSHVHVVPDEYVDDVRTGGTGFRRAANALYMSGADRVVVCSDHIRALLAPLAASSPDGLRVVRYGVDLERFRADDRGTRAREQLGLSERDVVVGFVGRLAPQKGIPHLIEVAARVLARADNARFVVIGDGESRRELESAVERIGRDRFVWLGERSDIEFVSAAFDIQIVPSEWEGLPIVILEAMAMEKPVVAFAIDGIPEEIVDGKTGLLVKFRDCGAMADAIVRLVADEGLRRAFGQAARRRIEEEFDFRRAAQTIASLYESALGHPTQP